MLSADRAAHNSLLACADNGSGLSSLSLLYLIRNDTHVIFTYSASHVLRLVFRPPVLFYMGRPFINILFSGLYFESKINDNFFFKCSQLYYYYYPGIQLTRTVTIHIKVKLFQQVIVILLTQIILYNMYTRRGDN